MSSYEDLHQCPLAKHIYIWTHSIASFSPQVWIFTTLGWIKPASRGKYLVVISPWYEYKMIHIHTLGSYLSSSIVNGLEDDFENYHSTHAMVEV